MGLFISHTVDPEPLEGLIKTALLRQPPSVDAAQAEAQAQAAVQAATKAKTEVHVGRIIFAICLFLLLLGLAVAAEAYEWLKDTAKIWGFAETVLGIIVGFLGGEASSDTKK